MPSNAQRAEWAHQSIMYYEQNTKCDREDSLGDLLASLMHWADDMGQDFDDALRIARMHHEEEVLEEEESS